MSDPKGRYGGVFLGVMGITGNIPTNFAYQHNNVGELTQSKLVCKDIDINSVGQPKRALCAAMMTTGGAIGGIVSGNIFQAKDAPHYHTALTICLSFQVRLVFSMQMFDSRQDTESRPS